MLGGTVWEGLGDVVLYGENISLRVGFVVINCFDICISLFSFLLVLIVSTKKFSAIVPEAFLFIYCKACCCDSHGFTH